MIDREVFQRSPSARAEYERRTSSMERLFCVCVNAKAAFRRSKLICINSQCDVRKILVARIKNRWKIFLSILSTLFLFYRILF